MSIRVVSYPLGGKLRQLDIYDNGQYIGGYEHSQHEDIEQTVTEVVRAAPMLREVFAAHGKFLIQWDGKSRVKSVRRADGTEVAEIPVHCWGKPSRE
jgi:hypothetical protein